MRLIDADALLEQMKHRRDYVGRPSDPVCLVEDAPTVSGWVSVKDRLPEKKCACLVAINSVWRALDFWEGDGWAISDENEITHWMPLPEPPKEDDA